MALDFPASPSVGQKYPASPFAGIPTYTWDGEKWTTQGGSIVSATPGTALPLMNAKPALVGVSTNFSREDHVHPTDASRAPFDAMAYSGLQINGGMEVSQELGATGIAAGGNGYVSDGWRVGQSSSSSGRMAAATASAVALGGFFPVGFRYLTHGYVTAAQASMGTNDLFMLTQYIEGWRIAKLGWGGGAANAQPITLGFWSAHVRPGLYTGTIVNAAHTRSYAFSYTQIASAAAQYNVITIPGCPDDVWAYDNTIGMMLNFSMGCGTTYTAPAANSWQNGYYLAGPGQVNAIAATTDVFRITGVIVLPGSEAPSAARSPFVMRPYDQELILCQRYFQVATTGLRYFNFTATLTNLAATHTLPVVMRAAPTTTQILVGANNNVNAYTFVAQSTKEILATMTAAAAVADTYIIGRTYNCDARL